MASTGELALFNLIWASRPHVSIISGEPLVPKGGFRWINQFSHCLPKSIYSKYRLKDFNIDLLLPDEHTFYGGFTEAHKLQPMYLNHKDAWDRLFAKRDKLKTQYFEERLKQ